MYRLSSVLLYLLLFALITASCSEGQDPVGDFWEEHTPFESDYNIQSLTKNTSFADEAEARGTSSISEASGLAYSRKNPGYIWSHQDKNNDNRLFLLDAATGSTVASYRVSGMQNRDWEDIEIASDPEEDGLPYLYLGDIGDNNEVYQSYTIYRFEEPEFTEDHRDQIVTLETSFEEIQFEYPDESHDAEVLMVDPETKDIYLATKRDFVSMLFVLPYPYETDNMNTVIHVGDFPFRFALAGTFSEDGREAMIKNSDKIFYWQRDGDQNAVELFASEPELAPYNPVEVQGEAICFDAEGGYFTLSELANGVAPVLYYYQRK